LNLNNPDEFLRGMMEILSVGPLEHLEAILCDIFQNDDVLVGVEGFGEYPFNLTCKRVVSAQCTTITIV
jgi:hypothetical protein